MTTSFPYLQVARSYDVDYWRVLQFADTLDDFPPRSPNWGTSCGWMGATVLAWCNEAIRRKEALTDKASIKLQEMDQPNPVGTAMAAMRSLAKKPVR